MSQTRSTPESDAIIADLVSTQFGVAVSRIERLQGALGFRNFSRVWLETSETKSESIPETLIARIEAAEDPAGQPAGIPPEPPLEPIRALLEAEGLPVPRRYAADPARGVELLEDLGEVSLADFARSASEPELEGLYAEACELPVRLQRIEPRDRVANFQRHLDAAHFQYKAEHFARWSLGGDRGASPAEAKVVRDAFERTRHAGGLKDTPGLVYLSPDPAPIPQGAAPPQGESTLRDWCGADRPIAVNTGVQRLLRDLDEMPMPDAGYRMIEPPHRRRTLADQPCSPKKVGKLSVICSVIATHGCKFNCDYCPIPAVNQRTWRYKSPQRMADEIAHIYETFGIVEFFGTDDNFFNNRETVVALFTAMAGKRLSDGTPLGERIRFYTEATEFDVYKNRDLLPMARAGGLAAIWFGIEDITAALINKGQTESKTVELFALLRK
ncbi:MAG: radical SAM protein, partial [Myxococcales bacterium]|nr:radical SAM protein [Myxococcales bacterium]